MTDTITTPPPATGDGIDSPLEALLYLDPAVISIGDNVRTDMPDANQFRKSIKERGVIEPVTVYRDAEGGFVCLRGQRRTVTAAEVGTPTGVIPVRVVARPEDADRITDQMVENIHRAGMAEKEVLAGVEQLALLGVSAAQITKRTALARPTVNAALAIAGKEGSRARVEAGDLTLTEAAIFAEFEGDKEATRRLEQRLRWGQGLEHEAQRLRDEAVERAAYDAEVERLRDQGLPVLAGEAAETARYAVRVAQLRNAEGEPIPEEEWPTVPGAALLLSEEWMYPHHDSDPDDHVSDDEYVEGRVDADPVKVYVPVWVVAETSAAEDAGYTLPTRPTHGSVGQPATSSEDQAEARREERRRVIANNKAWASAEAVRREWLTTFLSRKTPPKGAEALICEAVITGQHSLYKAMESAHPMLRKLLDVGADKSRWNSRAEIASIAAKASTPKALTMITLAAVLTAWEDSIDKQTWRNPTAWDGRVLGVLTEWGYQASDVETILLGHPDTDAQDDTTADSDSDSGEAGDGVGEPEGDAA